MAEDAHTQTLRRAFLGKAQEEGGDVVLTMAAVEAGMFLSLAVSRLLAHGTRPESIRDAAIRLCNLYSLDQGSEEYQQALLAWEAWADFLEKNGRWYPGSACTAFTVFDEVIHHQIRHHGFTTAEVSACVNAAMGIIAR